MRDRLKVPPPLLIPTLELAKGRVGRVLGALPLLGNIPVPNEAVEVPKEEDVKEEKALPLLLVVPLCSLTSTFSVFARAMGTAGGRTEEEGVAALFGNEGEEILIREAWVPACSPSFIEDDAYIGMGYVSAARCFTN